MELAAGLKDKEQPLGKRLREVEGPVCRLWAENWRWKDVFFLGEEAGGKRCCGSWCWVYMGLGGLGSLCRLLRGRRSKSDPDGGWRLRVKEKKK